MSAVQLLSADGRFAGRGAQDRDGHDRGASIRRTISGLQPGMHLCALIENDAQRRSVLVRFIADGLAQRQKILAITSPDLFELAAADLRMEGQPVDEALESGALVVMSNQIAYAPRAGFSMDSMLQRIEQDVKTAIAEGYTGARITGEVTRAFSDLMGAGQLCDYETRVNSLESLPYAVVLCQYDRNDFDPNLLLEVLQAHPIVGVGEYLYDNFFYLPPEVKEQKDPASARFDAWLQTLTQRQKGEWQVEDHRQSLAGQVVRHRARLAQARGKLSREARQRRDAERALERVNLERIATESRYQTIFNAASDMIFIQSLDGMIVDVNQVACDRYGYSREELIGSSPALVTDPDYQNLIQRRVEFLQRSDEVLTFETMNVTRAGQSFPVEISSRRLPESTGPAAIISIVRDITERKLAEQALVDSNKALQESESKFRSLVERSPLGIMLTDETGRIIEWNAAIADLYGLPPERTIGRMVWDVRVETMYPQGVPEEARRQMRETMQLFYQTGDAPWLYRLDGRELLHPDGGKRYIDRLRFPIRTDRGFMLASLMTDVTQQRQAEVELSIYRQHLEAMVERRTAELRSEVTERETVEAVLRESEARYRALVTQAPVLIMVVQNGHFTFMNPQAVAHLGFHDPADASGVSVMETVAPEFREKVRSRITRVMEGHQNETMAVELVRRDGASVQIEASSTPIQYRGEPAIMVVGQDVTDRLRYEKQLEASLSEKEVMLREIHHRVKNNLNVIIALIDLQKSSVSDPQTTQVFKDLQTRAYTMALVHESLYRSPNLAQVDFAGYLQRLIDYVTAAYAGPVGGIGAAGAASVRLEAENVPLKIETAIPCGLIVNELVTNALKYAFRPGAGWDGAGQHEIVVRMDVVDDGCIELTVADNGVGLPPGMDWRSAPSLGLQLVQVLARQISGQVDLLPSTTGAVWKLKFVEQNNGAKKEAECQAKPY